MATKLRFWPIALVAGLTVACATNPEIVPPPTDGAIAPKAAHDHHSMDLGPADGEYDLRFIDGMILHHQGALSMAESALKHSGRAPLKTLAQGIIKAQRQEIAQMQAWRRQWYPNASQQPVAWHGTMNHTMAMTPAQAQGMRMDGDLGSADPTYDLRFLDAMIVHHQGALVMAEDGRQKSQRPEVQQLAGEIRTSQRQEITQMQTWRQQWYGDR